MSTKNTTTSQNQYDPQAMNTYQGLQGGLGSAIGGYMNNPFSNPFMQTQMQMGNQQANLYGGTAMSNISRNMTASGMGGSNNPAALEMMNNQMRATSGMRANLGFLNPMQNAFTAQQNAMGLASQYRPLQTGGTQTQTQSGLGTWLPQLAGAAIGAVGMGMTGGMSGAGGGGSMFSKMGQAMPAASGMAFGGSGGYNMPSNPGYDNSLMQ